MRRVTGAIHSLSERSTGQLRWCLLCCCQKAQTQAYVICAYQCTLQRGCNSSLWGPPQQECVSMHCCRAPLSLTLCCTSTGVAGEQQSAPRPVDRPRRWHGAGRRPLRRRSARGVRRGGEKLTCSSCRGTTHLLCISLWSLMNQCPAHIQSCPGTSLSINTGRVWLPGGDSCSAWVSVAFSVASVLKLAPGWILVRSQLPQAGPWGQWGSKL